MDLFARTVLGTVEGYEVNFCLGPLGETQMATQGGSTLRATRKIHRKIYGASSG